MFRKVVVHFTNGALIRGFAGEYAALDDRLHLASYTEPGMHVTVDLRDVKAVYFVKDFFGDPAHQEKNGFEKTPLGKSGLMLVEFKDGEKLWGYPDLPASRGEIGFVMRPADMSGNNESVFVSTAATKLVW